MTINISGAALAFLAHVLIARFTDAATFGVYAYTLSWAAIVGLFAVFGLDSLTVRQVGESHGTDEASTRAYLSWAKRRLIMQVTLSAGIASIVLWSGLVPGPMRGAMTAGILLIVATAGLTVCQSAVQGFGIAYARWPDQVLRPLVLTVLVVGVVGLGLVPLEPVLLVLLAAFAVLAALAVSWLWLRGFVARRARMNGNQDTRAWTRSLAPLAFVAATSTLLNHTDVILLGIFLEEADVGVYSAAVRVAGLAGFGLVAINIVMMPLLAKLHGESNTAGIQQSLHAAARLAIVFTLAVGLLLVWQADFVLGLFGQEFVAGSIVLKVVLIGHLVNACAGCAGAYLMMTGNERQAAKILGVVVILNVVANVILIPLYGILGAAVSTAIFYSVWSIVGLVWVYTRFGFKASFI